MTQRVDEFLQALAPNKVGDAALLALLAHVAFSDGAVDDTELAFLARVLPGRDPEALRAWAQEQGQRPFDFRALAMSLPSVEERWKGLHFAVRMAWKDGEIAPEEHALLSRVVEVLELPPGALERVLLDLMGKGAGDVDPAVLMERFRRMEWDAVDWGEGALQSSLAGVVPEGAEGVLRIGLDGVEVLGLYREGLAGVFREGMAFLPWKDIVTFTRMPTISAAVQIHDERGRRWTLADFRLAGIGMLLTHIFGSEERPVGEPPRVERMERHKD